MPGNRIRFCGRVTPHAWPNRLKDEEPVPIITLLTDFGDQDGYVAAMKGVILSIAPDVTLVDITHAIAPQAIQQAAYVLAQAVPFFAPGAIHVAVVDPGVGSARRPLAVQTASAIFIGPDNGLFSTVLENAAGYVCIHLDQPRFWRAQPSPTFHGRDVFAPVAAHLARQVPLADLGTPISDPVRLRVDAPRRQPDGTLIGAIIHVDHFGNLISNIPGAWLTTDDWQVRIGQTTVVGIQPHFAAAPIGALLAYRGSAGTLEIGERNGHAGQTLGVGVGQTLAAEPRRH